MLQLTEGSTCTTSNTLASPYALIHLLSMRARVQDCAAIPPTAARAVLQARVPHISLSPARAFTHIECARLRSAHCSTAAVADSQS